MNEKNQQINNINYIFFKLTETKKFGLSYSVIRKVIIQLRISRHFFNRVDDSLGFIA